MHYYIMLTGSVDDEANFTKYIDNILGITIDIFTLFILFYYCCLKRLKPTLIATFSTTLLWSFCNVLYSRFFHHYISLSAISQSHSLFDDLIIQCCISEIRWTDIYYLIVILLFTYIINKPLQIKQPIKQSIIILSLIIGIDFLSYCLYCSLSPERRYFSFLVNRIEARHFSLSLHLVGPNVSSFRRGNIRTLAYEAALNLKQFRQLTEEQKRLIKKEINLTKKNISSESIETKNIIFIIVESYMSFVSDMRINDKEVTPFLNSLKTDSSVYYNGKMNSNVTIGESSDGQFIYMTGLLPLRSVVTISKARKATLPALPKLLNKKSLMIIPTVEDMWRQDEMCRQYGFCTLFTSKDYHDGYHSILTDKQLIELAIQKNSIIELPTFSVILTMSMHQPYYKQIDSTFHINNEIKNRKDLTCYLNACHYTDLQLKQYFDFLKKNGLYDTSLIIIAADHPVLCTDFGGVDKHIPLYIINAKGIPQNIWKGECNQIDVFPTILDMLGIESDWYGLGCSLLSPNYTNSIPSRKWDISEWIIMGDYFKQ